MTIKIKLLSVDIPKPERATTNSAGFDLSPRIAFTLTNRLMCQKVPLGVAVEIPKGHVGILRARSSTAAEHGLFILGGVIDSDYRGEIFAVVAQASGYRGYDFYPGEPIFQLLILKCNEAAVEIVGELSETKRGSKGFGEAG